MAECAIEDERVEFWGLQLMGRNVKNFILIILCLSQFSACVSGQAPFSDVQELRDLWTAQQEEIQTARVVLHWANSRARGEKKSWSDVEQAMADVEAAAASGDDEVLRAAVVACVDSFSGHKDKWPTLTIVRDGTSLRNSFARANSEDSEDEATIDDLNFKDGVSSRFFATFGSATLETGRSNEAKFDVDILRPTPILSVDWKIVSTDSSAVSTAIESGEGDEATSVSLDSQTAVMTRLIQKDTVYRFRAGVNEYSGGVVMPSAGVDIRMKRGAVRSIIGFVVEHAEFNMPVSEQDLLVNVPTGTRIIDRRNSDRTQIGFAKRAGDAVSLADELPPRKQRQPNLQSKSDVGWLIWANAAFVLLIVIGLAIRRK